MLSSGGAAVRFSNAGASTSSSARAQRGIQTSPRSAPTSSRRFGRRLVSCRQCRRGRRSLRRFSSPQRARPSAVQNFGSQSLSAPGSCHSSRRAQPLVRRVQPLAHLVAPLRAFGGERRDVEAAHSHRILQCPAVEFVGRHRKRIGNLHRKVPRVDVAGRPQLSREIVIDVDPLHQL